MKRYFTLKTIQYLLGKLSKRYRTWYHKKYCVWPWGMKLFIMDSPKTNLATDNFDKIIDCLRPMEKQD
jgi:hypothetical protein